MFAEQKTRHRNAFERMAEAAGNGIGWLAEHGVLLSIFGVIWAVVGAGLLFAEPTVRETWTVIGAHNLVVQGVLWLLFLPVMAGLWIWHTDWPSLVRILLIVGLAGWNVLVFMPRRVGPLPPSESATTPL